MAPSGSAFAVRPTAEPCPRRSGGKPAYAMEPTYGPPSASGALVERLDPPDDLVHRAVVQDPLPRHPAGRGDRETDREHVELLGPVGVAPDGEPADALGDREPDGTEIEVLPPGVRVDLHRLARRRRLGEDPTPVGTDPGAP